MGIGLRIPVGVNTSGKANLDGSDVEYNRKILSLAFGQRNDRNPFQDVGMDGRFIFNIKTAAFRGRVQAEMNRILNKFKSRVRLKPNETIKLDFSVEGEAIVSFEYIDLLTDTVQTFKKLFTR